MSRDVFLINFPQNGVKGASKIVVADARRQRAPRVDGGRRRRRHRRLSLLSLSFTLSLRNARALCDLKISFSPRKRFQPPFRGSKSIIGSQVERFIS